MVNNEILGAADPVLISERVSGSVKRALSFWFFLSGETSRLELSIKANSKTRLIWHTTDQTKLWKRSFVNFDNIGAYEYEIFIHGHIEADNAAICLDEFVMYSGSDIPVTLPEKYDCRDKSLEKISSSRVCDFNEDCLDGFDESVCGQCDFNHGWCGWVAKPNSVARWHHTSLFHLPPLPPRGNGSLPESYLLYRGKVGSLRAPAVISAPTYRYKKAKVTCFMTFWFSFNNLTTSVDGRLTISVNINGRTGQRHRVNIGKEFKWEQASVQIGQISGNWSVAIAAEKLDLVGVDDVKFVGCGYTEALKCTEDEYMCPSTRVCILDSQICDGVDDCGDGYDERRCDNYTKCTFEDDGSICDWMPSGSGLNRWVEMKSSASEAIGFSGPFTDHTFGLDNEGYYIAFESSSVDKNFVDSYSSSLVSTNYSVDGTNGCMLGFFYYMYGPGVRSLEVYTRMFSDSPWSLAWFVNEELGQMWLKGHAHVSTQGLVQFKFVASRKGGMKLDHRTIIALDDIFLSPGCVKTSAHLPSKPPQVKCKAGEFSCPSGTPACIDQQLVCDEYGDCSDGYDESMCGSCDFDDISLGMCGWKDSSLGTFQFSNVLAESQIYEHTVSFSSTGLVKTIGFPEKYSLPAILTSPALKASSNSCAISFWYYVGGSGLEALELDIGYMRKLSVKILPQRQWQQAKVAAGAQQAGWEARIVAYASTGTPFVIIDNILFTSCNIGRYGVDCNFDNGDFHKGLCYWKSDTTYAAKPFIRSNNPKVPLIGSSIDERLRNNDYYILQNVSALDDKRPVSKLVSPVINATSSACFSFWHYVHSNGYIGKIKVYLQRLADPQPRLLFDTSHSVDGSWLHKNVNLNSSSAFVIILEFATSSSKSSEDMGIVAFDNIKFHPSSWCDDGGFCDFDRQGTCSWSAPPHQKYNWQRTTSYDIPYLRDHSYDTANGHYLALFPQSTGISSAIRSVRIKTFEKLCLQFWFTIESTDSKANLSVYIMSDDSTNHKEVLWLTSANRNSAWKHAHVTLASFSPFDIYIEGKLSAEKNVSRRKDWYLAIDDISISYGMCHSETFCSFQFGLCEWTLIEGWTRSTSQDFVTYKTHPRYDHSYGSPNGFFLYTYVSAHVKNIHTMQSPEIFPTSDAMCLTLYVYNMASKSGMIATSMNLVDGMNYTLQPIYMQLIRNNTWVKKAIDIPNKGKHIFTITLQAKMDPTYVAKTGDAISVDDIGIYDGSCDSITTPLPSTTLAPPIVKPSILNSNFEQPLSRWGNVTSFGNFIRVSARKASQFLYWPKVDHTTKTSFGHYLLASCESSGKSFALKSVHNITVGNEGGCFQVAYIVQCSQRSSLTIKLRQASSTDAEILTQMNFNSGPTWRMLSSFINDAGTYNVLISVDHLIKGCLMALDDISYAEGKCPPTDECDFENGICGFQTPFGYDSAWTRMLPNYKYGPLNDHTGSSVDGHYLAFTNASCTSVIVSPLYSSDRRCLKFWYSVQSKVESKDLLSVHMQHADTSELIWSYGLSDGEVWDLAQVKLKPMSDYRLVFTSVTSRWYRSPAKIAIDDIKIRGDCPTVGSCDFETDMCAWSNYGVNISDQWSRSMSKVLNFFPEKDHTYDSEYGVFLISGSDKGTLPRLQSAIILADDAKCFSFWFWQHGPFSSRLYLYLRPVTATKYQTAKDQLLWSMSKASSSIAWQNVRVQLNKTTDATGFRLYFILHPSGAVHNTLALDDFSLTAKHCSPTIPASKVIYHCDGKEIHEDQKCDFRRDCSDGRDESACGNPCTFDHDLCNWTPYPIGSDTVERVKSKTGGYFLRPTSNMAVIISPVYQHSSDSCVLTFRYKFDQLSKAKKKAYYVVYVKKEYEKYHQSILKSNYASKDTPWLNETIRIGRQRDPFRIFITLIGSEQHFFAVGIDDISFKKCGSPKIIKQKCARDEFKCTSGDCISNDLVCDFTDDCSDSSDENHATARCDRVPGRCAFEGLECDWSEQDSNGTLERWLITGGSSCPLDRDHTLNDGTGHVAMLTSTTAAANRTAVLISPYIVNKASLDSVANCSLRLYIYFKNKSALDFNRIAVYTSYRGLPWRPRGSVTTTYANYYNKEVFKLGDLTEEFRVKIEGTSSHRSAMGSSSITIDDISFSEGCRYSTKTFCHDRQFACNDLKTCIDSNQVCNFRLDCPNGDDEALCPSKCTFDDVNDPTCYWQTAGGSGIITARDAAERSTCALSYDHTDEQPSSHYFGFGNTTTITSPKFEESTSTCQFKFWYFYCSQMPDVLLELVDVGRTTTLIRSEELPVPKYPSWLALSVGLGRQVNNFLVKIVLPSSALSTIAFAIDDVAFVDCAFPKASTACSNDDFHCTTTKSCIGKDRLCDLTDDCGDASDEDANICSYDYKQENFESGLGKMFQQGINGADDDFDWLNAPNNAMLARNTYPSIDHTYSNNVGHYMLIPSTIPFHYNQRAWLVSRHAYAPTTGSNACKLTLYLFMFGEDVNRFSIGVRYHKSGEETAKYTASASIGPFWKRVQVQFSETSPYQIIIEGRAGKSYSGNIAIDDLTLSPDCRFVLLFSFQYVLKFPSGSQMYTSSVCSWSKHLNLPIF